MADQADQDGQIKPVTEQRKNQDSTDNLAQQKNQSSMQNLPDMDKQIEPDPRQRQSKAVKKLIDGSTDVYG